mmetsp:Transcript_17233/g.31144  ORF Transcript_17233/g.31144 Transcript_17233/m.31144 type:complete len:248 (-) Transcript_17233:213-956(-)|eukprot:CAMPEP_0201600704 /NCGR_PEP_ID=MMETSP0492-20130828/1730_1 /ASSEMBLY_ACC=CAM_ASM_000837 /TAXON_ID=420259 /ORGANISM="Thalassiosira gravida, Strain GMp14c1" /LENGTH=247 /DNA_ID=CAMNT_0048063577 /DNA_START=95 /DNA_END=838 /DNA_ORIENTATION=-
MKSVKRRQTKVDAKSTDGDVESQPAPGPEDESEPRTRPAGASPRSAPASGGGNPASLFVRKVMLLAARDVAENGQGNYLLTIIKDVISGTILGVFFLMILIFLDYRNIVQLGSARAFRRAAFELMTDPETVKSIEESIDVKFIPLDVHKSMTEEIARNQDKIKNNAGLKQHEEDLLKKTGELDGMKKEYDEWKAKGDKALGLDRWCDGCKGGWGNCGARVKYLVDTYHTPEIKAKVDIMNSGKCVRG